ncbi:MAG TPA: Cd(II)/Pb(II)-responsive transcriptional regulator [Geobacteraceae bacterium]|nr:Cd(II)/Pb(II)-responsive transcriptional regulator [Geobacteraceae bacterium]
MLIGELAKLSGCDTGTIRYYEREGLLRKPYRAESGYRKYTDAHLLELSFVRHCRSLGMTLAEIRVLQGFQDNPQAPCAEINELIDRQIARIHEQIDVLNVLEKQLYALRNCCDTNLPASECGILKALAAAAENGEGA